ncbi:MAG: non-homologous end-joining DNA ligase [Cyanobacteria bacterium TGS_CYA1]|nr:non-homologous end-joining DNA ligase [Cyanobacteria bacterium TGS_CYA1]
MAKRALSEYKRKRDFSETPEPGPLVKSKKSKKLTFVVQKHAARRLHYDFRLELDGVLLSWAVPKGPSTIAGEKRLAVMTEDHPIEYGKFHGTIPKGNYGAGEVEIWDKGTYVPDGGEEEMRHGLDKGKISFTLNGDRLQGSWALVKMKGRGDDNWLLLKHGDDYEYKPVDRSKSKSKSKPLPDMKPMLCSLAKEPFDKKGFIYEPKFDGIRMLAFVKDGKCTLKSRNAKDITNDYKDIANKLARLKHDCILDGELGALDENGTPNFELWQQSKLGAKSIDLVYFVFDMLYFDGDSLTSKPLIDRKKLLKKTLVQSSNIQYVEDIKANGIKAYEACMENKLEGIVAKVSDSVYESGRRSANWIKVKSTQSSEYYIIGYSKGTGGRAKTFGALHLAYFDSKKQLQYAGKVGTGFNEVILKDLMKRLKPLVTKTNPLESGGPRNAAVFVEPKLVAEIKYAEKTRDGKLRAPVFMRLRDDLITTGGKENSSGKQKENDIIEVEGHKIKVTSLSKVFWPDAGITKRDYIDYLLGIGPYILPHLKDRPFTLIRYPDGIGGEKFFQKHYPYKLPEFVETVKHYSEQNDKDSAYLMCNNLATLVWFAQIADLEFHVAHTRIDPNPDAKNITGKFTGSEKEIENSLLNYPDFVVLDLDPYLYSGKEKKGEEPELHKKGFEKACAMAVSLNEMLLDLKIKSFVKTSGKTGLHIFIPIKRNIKYEIVRDMAESIGRHLLERHPNDVTMDWSVKKRTGKVFFDYNMNARGKTLASIYSCRNSPIASVSMPLTWEQVESKEVYPLDFHLKNVPQILGEQGDLWADILKSKNDLTKLLK